MIFIVIIHLGISQLTQYIRRHQIFIRCKQPVLIHRSTWPRNRTILHRLWLIHLFRIFKIIIRLSIDVIVCADIYLHLVTLRFFFLCLFIAESTLSTLNSFYPTSFHYPSAQTQPAGLYFGWNQHSPLARTHSANYSPSSECHWALVLWNIDTRNGFLVFASSYPVMNSSSVQMMPDEKITVNGRLPPFGSTSAYSSYLNMMHPIHFNMPSLNVATASMNHVVKRSLPSKTTKRSRLTAHLRSEILQLKAQKPTIFVWEIQQNLLQKGICTAQTIPSVRHCFIFIIIHLMIEHLFLGHCDSTCAEWIF